MIDPQAALNAIID